MRWFRRRLIPRYSRHTAETPASARAKVLHRGEKSARLVPRTGNLPPHREGGAGDPSARPCKGHAEAGALARSAPDGQGPARRQDDLQADGKPEPGSLWLPREGVAHLPEALEDRLSLLMGDPHAGVLSRGVRDSRITTLSYGEEPPPRGDRTEACWSQNRRAHLLVERQEAGSSPPGSELRPAPVWRRGDIMSLATVRAPAPEVRGRPASPREHCPSSTAFAE